MRNIEKGIHEKLCEIEEKEHVKVLHAVESAAVPEVLQTLQLSTIQPMLS